MIARFLKGYSENGSVVLAEHQGDKNVQVAVFYGADADKNADRFLQAGPETQAERDRLRKIIAESIEILSGNPSPQAIETVLAMLNGALENK